MGDLSQAWGAGPHELEDPVWKGSLAAQKEVLGWIVAGVREHSCWVIGVACGWVALVEAAERVVVVYSVVGQEDEMVVALPAWSAVGLEVGQEVAVPALGGQVLEVAVSGASVQGALGWERYGQVS